VRLFIAAEFDQSLRRELDRSAQLLGSGCVRASLTRRENYHLTLVFLGEVSPDRLSSAAAAMDECGSTPIPVVIGAPGRFRQRGGDTLWRGVEADEALFELQSRLTARLRSRGFVPEERAYRPHVTLARRAVLREGVTLSSLGKGMPPLTAEIGALTLLRSHSPGGVLTYTPVYRKVF